MTFSLLSFLTVDPPRELGDAARVVPPHVPGSDFLQLGVCRTRAVGLVVEFDDEHGGAGGFFPEPCARAFVVAGERIFRLPGIGSYMSVAIEKNDMPAMIYGVGGHGRDDRGCGPVVFGRPIVRMVAEVQV